MLFREALPDGTLDLLIGLCNTDALADFSLAGGTSLALRFGHRLSVDLDFFTTQPFDNEELAESLKEKYKVDERRRGATGITAFIEGVKVDFVKYKYLKLQPDDVIGSVRLMSLPDVAAMKLSAVTNRGAKKDFYDLHMLLETMGLHELLRVYQSKFPDTDPMMLLRSLTYFMDAEEDEDPVSLINQDWEQVKSGIIKAVKEML